MAFKSSNFPVNLEEKSSKTVKNPDLYSPVWSKDLADGKYVSYIRFLPNMLNFSTPIVEKAVSWLKDPSNPQGHSFAVDSPETIGQRDNMITNLYWALRNTKDEAKIELAKNCLGTSRNYYSFVQILSDPNLPAEEAYKVKLFRYGSKIREKIIDECRDSEVSPFDLCNGSIFKLVLTKQNGQNNYDLSKFVDAGKAQVPVGYCYKVEDGNWYVASMDVDDETSDFIEDQLKGIQEDMNTDDMKYHPWTPEIEEKVRQHCESVQQYAYPELLGAHQVIAGAVPTVPMSSPSAVTFTPKAPQVATSAQVAHAPVSQVAQPKAAQVAAAPVNAAQVAPQMPTSRVAPAPQQPTMTGYSAVELERLLGDE